MQSNNSMLLPISQTASKPLQNHLESWRVGYVLTSSIL